ncbi:MAG: hypothetical protein ABI880_02310 [Acidobacteriota bacterium]
MTDREAVALATFGYPRRRLLAAITRTWLARPIPDVDTILPRGSGEPLMEWACRCAGDPVPSAEARTCLEAADRVLERARRLGHVAVSLGDSAYPDRLRQIPDPPAVLWVRGSTAALSAARRGARCASSVLAGD